MTNTNISLNNPSVTDERIHNLTGTDDVSEQVVIAEAQDETTPSPIESLRKLLANRSSYTNPRDALVAVAAALNQVQTDTANAETAQAQLNQEVSNELTQNAIDGVKKVLEQIQKFLHDVEEAREEQRKQEERNGILNIIFGVVEMIVGAITLNPAMIFAGALQVTVGALMVSHQMEAARDFIASAFEACGMSKEDAKLAADLFIFAVIVIAQFMATGGVLGFVEALTMGSTMSEFLIQDLAKHIVDHYYSNLSAEEKAAKEQEIQQDFGYVLMALSLLTALCRLGPALVSGAKGAINLARSGNIMNRLNELRAAAMQFFRNIGTAAQEGEAIASQKTLWEKCKDLGSNLKSQLFKNPQVVKALIESISSISVNIANAESGFQIAEIKKDQARIKRYWALLEAELLINNMVIKNTQEVGEKQVQDFSNRLDSHRKMIGQVIGAIETEGSSYVSAMQA
jgi:hypothetical protein